MVRLHTVTQPLASGPIQDVEGEVRQRLDSLGLAIPRGPVAITAGSRGIANLPLITRTAGQWLREQGAEPFLVPSMGSHNGATAEGQRAMLEALGMDELSMQMPIRSSMEVVEVGEVSTGKVWMDRQAYEAAGVLVLNRIKLHTSFGGPPYGQHVESGITKMMTVGLGKIDGAQTFHAAPTREKPAILHAMGEAVLATGKVWAGLAILEDGYDQTAELHAIKPADILQQEPPLLAHYADRYFPRLPFDQLNVLIVETIGKNYSGTGMDTNVIGRRGLSDVPDPPFPKINAIAALGLSPQSQGNAIGVGLADVVTQQLADAMDRTKTELNAKTAGEPAKAQLPRVLADKAAVYEWLEAEYGPERWVVIPNTLHLGQIQVSEDLLSEL